MVYDVNQNGRDEAHLVFFVWYMVGYFLAKLNALEILEAIAGIACLKAKFTEKM
jgi:hypothetical protein